ncbi:glycosyltransferase family 2 protein [Microbacterium sp. LMI12-1-1.1]|uniref:glycosyltransferase family 2 protein n=1 Tax=Microbacterium sp. LMI12-1-1.1 TaxID=3135225 RepID=UPI00341BC3F9
MPATLGVVIPAFNSADVITHAIQSARAAGATEVIVVDDGSSDATAQVASSSGATVIRQANAGAAVARQRGAESVSTDFVIFLDADDELVVDGVRRSIEVLVDDESIAVAAGVVVGFSRSSGKEERFPVRFTPVTTTSLLVKGHGPWPPCNAVVRVAALRASQRMSPEPLHPRFADDYELLIRLSRAGAIAVRDEPTSRYSMDGGKSVASAERAITTKEQVRSYYAEAFDIEITHMTPREIRRSAQARIARAHVSSRNWIGAGLALTRWVLLDFAGSASLVAQQLVGAKSRDR